MVNQTSYKKEFCNVILNVFFATLHKGDMNIFTYDPITYSLLKGWLDILLTKTTPKPDDFYTKPLDKAFCKLNSEGLVNLLTNVSLYLKNTLTLGGNDGAEMSSE